MAIAQTQTEQTIRPHITVLTSQWDCQNRWNSDRSEEVNGKADAEMSAGFMGASFRRSDRAMTERRAGAGTKGSSQPHHARRPRPENFARTQAGPATGRTEIIAKLVQTRAQHRSFAPNEARLCLTRG